MVSTEPIIFILIKANFKISHEKEQNKADMHSESHKDNATENEFEEFVVKSGAVGSFMIFRSDKKDDELGLEQL